MCACRCSAAPCPQVGRRSPWAVMTARCGSSLWMAWKNRHFLWCRPGPLSGRRLHLAACSARAVWNTPIPARVPSAANRFSCRMLRRSSRAAVRTASARCASARWLGWCRRSRKSPANNPRYAHARYARSQTPFGNAGRRNSVSHRGLDSKRSFETCVPKQSLGTSGLGTSPWNAHHPIDVTSPPHILDPRCQSAIIAPSRLFGTARACTMSRHFTCRQGHQWELSATSSSLSAHLDPVCPVCGAPAQASAPDVAGKSDSGSVRLSLGPAPVEAKARVPEPLPVRQAKVPAPGPPTVRPSEIFSAQKVSTVPRVSEPKYEPPTPQAVRLPTTFIRSWLGWIAGIVSVALFIVVVVIAWVIIHAQDRVAAERQWALAERDRGEKQRLKAERLEHELDTARTAFSEQLWKWMEDRREMIEQRDKAKLDAERADKATQEMDRRRQEQANLREQAELAAKLAQEAREEALKGRGDSEGKLVHLFAGQGVRLMERGELLESLVWLTEALRLAQGDARREAPHRLRLAAILAQCPRPVQAWFHDKPVMHAEFSPDGRRVLTTAKDGKARLWDATVGKAIGDALGGDTDVVLAHFSRDGRRVLTALADNNVRVWDSANGKPITPPLEHTGPVLALALSPDGKRLHTISRDAMARATAFHTWDAATGDAIGEPWEFTHVVQTATFSPDSRHILSTGMDGRAFLTDLTGKDSHPAFDQGGPLRQVAFSPDSKFAATCAGKAARVWNAETRHAISPALVHPEDVSLIAVSPDGWRAVTACADRVIRIWDFA